MSTSSGRSSVPLVQRGPPFRFVRIALFWHVVLLAAWWGLCHGAVGLAWVLLPLAAAAYVRNFNALHQLTHTKIPRHLGLEVGRWLAMIVHSPLQYGHMEVAHDHRLHHAHPGSHARDPNAYLNNVPWWQALINAATQPEQAVCRWVWQRGWSRRLSLVILSNTAIFAGLYFASGLRGLLIWTALVRIGSVSVWFVFDWVLHHPRVWGREIAGIMPRPLKLVWWGLFGRENLNGVLYHARHHQHPQVPDG